MQLQFSPQEKVNPRKHIIHDFYLVVFFSLHYFFLIQEYLQDS